MGKSSGITLYAHTEPYRSLGWALFGARWATVAVVVLLALTQPAVGRLGIPQWGLVLLFAAYNLLIDVLGLRWSWPRSFARRAVLDLPVVGLIYFLGEEHGGLPFVFVFLAVICAAASTSPRRSLLYTAVAGTAIVALHPAFTEWSLSGGGLRELGAELTIIALAGAGTAILARRLAMEHEEARVMRDEADRLAELDRVRADFLSTVSHELRTPLTAARAGLGMLEASATERLREEELALLGNARRNTELLDRLVDDLLALNRLKTNTMRLEREPLDLRGTARDAAYAVGPLFKRKGQTLRLGLPEELPCKGDARSLERAIVNLLANAHRHTPPGTRVIIAGEKGTDEVTLSVSDDGPGVPPEEKEAVFRRFYRLSPKEDGSGLGLAIAQGIVELHGGRIRAEGGPEGGTTFRVSLPRCSEGERTRR